MKNIFRDNKIRFIYVTVSILVIIFAYSFSNYFLDDLNKFNVISYAGTIITIIGLLITISEVLHSLIITKSLQVQARAMLADFKDKEINIISHELDIMLEYIRDDINDDNFPIALRQFCTFKRTFNRVRKNYVKYNSEMIERLNTIETLLVAFRGATAKSPVDNKSKKKALDNLMKVKQNITNQLINEEDNGHASN